MAFCIECGTKSPDQAKFCPQCGTPMAVLQAQEAETQETGRADKGAKVPVEETAEVVNEPVAENAQSEESLIGIDGDSETAAQSEIAPDSESDDTDISPETSEILVETPVEPDPIKDAPSLEDSLAATANIDTPVVKSKSKLWVGLSLIALLAAGGGAYALGLFPAGGADSEIAATPSPVDPAPQAVEIEPSAIPDTPSALDAYQAAIKTGRISDLGKFAQEYPENSLAKDAQDAAFASLMRQRSPLAYNTFVEYFPGTDLSAYTEARSESDLAANPSETKPADTTPAGTDISVDVNLGIPKIRPSITSRVEALEPFITQGDIAYALSVADELLAIPDLNEEEATYLLNVRARAENIGGPNIDVSAPTPGLPEPDAEPAAPAAAFDTPAKPIDRFGSITPDEATEPGECDMTFSVDITGAPVNIVASCTQLLFAAPATETVGEWRYSSAMLNGSPVQQDGLAVKIKFHLDEPE